MTIPLNSNGHRRRQLRARVLSEETHCAICDQRVDKTLKVEAGQHYKKCTKPNCTGCKPHPMRAEIDEDLPRARGGSLVLVTAPRRRLPRLLSGLVTGLVAPVEENGTLRGSVGVGVLVRVMAASTPQPAPLWSVAQ